MNDSDFVMFLAENQSDETTNGGRKSYVEASKTQTLNNVFPNVDPADCVAGITRYRKTFIQNINGDNKGLYSPLFGINYDSKGGDFIRVALGTYQDTQANIDGSYNFIGTGELETAVTGGVDNELEVEFGLTDLVGLIQPGDPILVTDKINVKGTIAGHYNEWVTVDSVAWAGSVATITLVSPITNSFSTGWQTTIDGETVTIKTKVSMALSLPTLIASVGNYSSSTTSGILNSGSYPVLFDNEGSIRDDITLTFTDAGANYSIEGAYLGSLGSGNIGSDKIVTNPNTGTPYFTIPALIFGGTWALGETVDFTVYQAAQGLWWKENVPALTEAYLNNEWGWFLYGGSAG